MNRYFGLHTLEGEWHALLPRYLLLGERVQGRRILDIGCGSGIGASLLLELGAQVVDAIDHRPAVLELARMKHAKHGLDFHVMFWEELDFPDDTFDLVICFDPSSPVTDPSLLQEVRRVLKPEGEYVCAIERTQISGFETLLPRYGYADSAESIDVHPHDARPPQVGELSAVFDKTASILQRPSLSFVFDAQMPDDEGQDGARHLPSDESFQKREGDDAAVELWFCGAADGPAPPTGEIRLPYYGLVERLRQVHNELQMRQVRGFDGEADLFSEIVDSAEPPSDDDFDRERTPTNEFRVVTFDDDAPTNLRNPPVTEENLRGAAGDGLESQLNELSALYQRVRHDFQSVVGDAQRALQERDTYIEHLVNQVHALQERFRSDAVDDGLEEGTNVFDGEESSAGEESSGANEAADSADDGTDGAVEADEAATDKAGDDAADDRADDADEEVGDETSDEESR